MRYIIDGHNLIGQLPDISLRDEHDEAMLVQKLTSFTAGSKDRCVVVFDRGLPGGESRMSTSRVTVRFAPTGSTADQVIIFHLEDVKDPAAWTVVSNDHEVLTAARKRRINTLSSSEFAARLRPAAKPAARKRTRAQRREDGGDIHQTDDEIAEWLKVFGE